jgi:hypothetical protein
MLVLLGIGDSVVATVDTALTRQTAASKVIVNYPEFNVNDVFGWTSFALPFPRQSPDGTRLAVRSIKPNGTATLPQIWAARRNMDTPPVITAVGGQSVDHALPVVYVVAPQDTTLSLGYSRSDSEGDALVDSAYSLRPDLGMTFNSSTQTLSWAVADAPVDTYTVRFQTTVPSGGTDYAIAKIYVRDITRPARVTDLAADCDPDNPPNGFILSWTAPADDSTYSGTGAAYKYELRRSTSHITEANWNSATVVCSLSSSSPGSTQTFNVTASGTLYYFAMKVRDDVSNSSLLSNEVGVIALGEGEDCIPGGFFGGGGGGGGSSVRRARGASIEGGQSENTLLNGVARGTAGHDAYRLPWSVSNDGGSVSLNLRELAGRGMDLDRVRLLVADYGQGSRAYRVGESILSGTTSAAAGVRNRAGTDLTSTLNGQGSYAPAETDTLTVQLGNGGGSSALVIAMSGSGSIDVQAYSEGGWSTVNHGAPRLDSDEAAFAAVGSDSLRVIVRGHTTLTFVGRLVADNQAPTVHEATLTSATTSELGNVASELAAVDASHAAFVGPDTAVLVFSVPGGNTAARSCFLMVDATPLGPQAEANHLKGAPREDAERLPTRFALEQNRPNPFAARAEIRFALPVASQVRLEVFDAAGRRLKTLAQGPFPAGYQSVEWDGRDNGGNLVRPGVYLYRLVAGSFRDQKKMVLLAR